MKPEPINLRLLEVCSLIQVVVVVVVVVVGVGISVLLEPVLVESAVMMCINEYLQYYSITWNGIRI